MRRVLLVVALLLVGIGPAHADAPSAQGWWNLANQGVQPPNPPDVPDDGLLLQSGVGTPSAYAALRFTLPSGATAGSLTLPVSGTAQASGVQACVTRKAFTPAQGGPLADAPEYDCKRSSKGVLSEDGASLVFADLSGLVGADGTLSVALVPGDTDRVALQKPPSTALAVRSGSGPAQAAVPPPPVPPPVTAPAPAAPQAPAAAPTTGAVAPTVADPPALQAQAPVSAGAPEPQVAASPAAPAAAPAVPAAARPVDRGPTRTRIVLVLEALLVAVTFGLVGVGPARRLAALTGQPVAAASRGIGRFTRERSGPAPSL